ncbi:MAG: hypothetical protein IJP92_13005 [Lachnospiraceae bacterium]|nr:hypothetical protein [Lachnospiraceae bacterium]
MTERDILWYNHNMDTELLLKQYREETHPGKRRSLLEQLEAEGCEGSALRRQLFEKRYTDPRHPEREVDLFLWNLSQLIILADGGHLFRPSHEKKIRAVLGDFTNGWESEKDADGRILYEELRNTFARYLTTCEGPHYRRKAFGLIAASEEERAAAIRADAVRMTYAIARRYGLEQETAVLCEAVADEYHAAFPDAAPLAEGLQR